MNLDDLKGLTLNDCANDADGISTELSLSEEIKKHMAELRKKSFLVIVMLIVISLIYVTLGSRTEGPGAEGFFLGYVTLMISALYIFLRNRREQKPDLSLPLNQYLLQAEKNLRYMGAFDLFFVLSALGALGLAGGLIFVYRLGLYIDNKEILTVIWIIFYSLLTAFGFYAGKKEWEKTSGALYKKIKSQLKELEAAEKS